MYADSDHDPFSGGRQMNCHFATPFIDSQGDWLDHTTRYNVTSDVSCVAGQVGRALGLAQASNIYKINKELNQGGFPITGQKSFLYYWRCQYFRRSFWETMNAAGVMQVPLVMIVWDDGYGISVPVEYQTIKSSISRALEGFIGEKKVKAYRYLPPKAGIIQSYVRYLKKLPRLQGPIQHQY